ncbi:MAG: hypothetical protein ACPIOQ_10840, partial [Promethearchaeia archaeon]
MRHGRFCDCRFCDLTERRQCRCRAAVAGGAVLEEVGVAVRGEEGPVGVGEVAGACRAPPGARRTRPSSSRITS